MTENKMTIRIFVGNSCFAYFSHGHQDGAVALSGIDTARQRPAWSEMCHCEVCLGYPRLTCPNDIKYFLSNTVFQLAPDVPVEAFGVTTPCVFFAAHLIQQQERVCHDSVFSGVYHANHPLIIDNFRIYLPLFLAPLKKQGGLCVKAAGSDLQGENRAALEALIREVLTSEGVSDMHLAIGIGKWRAPTYDVRSGLLRVYHRKASPVPEHVL